MAITHGAATRNKLALQVLADIDQDVGAGKLVFHTVDGVPVATLSLSDPAGSVTDSILTFNGIVPDANAVGGVVAKATIEDNSGDQIILTDSVLKAGGDINMSSLIIEPGDAVECSSLSYIAPA